MKQRLIALGTAAGAVTLVALTGAEPASAAQVVEAGRFVVEGRFGRY
jgi:hypothetical protein